MSRLPVEALPRAAGVTNRAVCATECGVYDTLRMWWRSVKGYSRPEENVTFDGETMLAYLSLIAALTTSSGSSRTASVAPVTVQVDSATNEVVVTVGPMDIAPSMEYAHHATDTYRYFEWPVSGWVRGYRVDVVDSAGALLPRSLLHHAGMANLDRRQLAYPLAERLFAAGPETTPAELPGSMGLPMSAATRMSVYFALMNLSDKPVEGARLRITMGWTPSNRKKVTSIFPLFLDANSLLGQSSTFTIAPGHSEKSSEFTLPAGGYVRALGGHLHNYASEIRLEDAVNGDVIARLGTKKTADGHLESIDRTRFLLSLHGKHLVANHRYRVVAVYDKPTREPISGAMGFLAGIFIPDDATRWPPVNSADPIFQKDLASFSEDSSESMSMSMDMDH
jgi:hypothetical protein